jgi:2-phospho-L-lactate guanylyltransferase
MQFLSPSSAIVNTVGRRQKTAVLVPIKPFGLANSRLAPVCSPSERESLTRSMLRSVIESAQNLRVALLSSSSAEDVRRFALTHGTRFLAEPDGGDINSAVSAGVNQLAVLGYGRVAIVHSDLPLARDITWLADSEGIIVVPDRTGRGTNAISVPSHIGFQFSYGPGSFERHCNEARRHGFEPTVVLDPDGLSMDVDEPADLERMNLRSTEVV